MVDVWLPYGKTEVCLRIPARNFLGSIEPKEKPGVPDAKAEIKRALKEPIGSKRLDEIVKPESRVAIVVDAAYGPAPSHIMVQSILDDLSGAGVKDENVTVIFGCGAHKAVADEEAVRILGEEVLKRVKALSHNSRAQDLVYLGVTSKHGTKVYVNRIFAEADVKILTSCVRFHYYAGYSGGGTGVLPGVSGEDTIRANHAMLLNPNARVGVLDGNPIHEDMVEAAKMAKVDFTLNVVTNSKGDVVKAFAGDLEQAFYEGVKVVDEMYRVSVNRRADIVVVSPGGHPDDVNLFQAYGAVESALEAVKRGGVVILAAECSEGYGNKAFYDWMVNFKDLKIVEREIKRNFVFGGHGAYYLLRALQKAQIILVSVMPDYYAVNVFRLKTARTVNEALNQAFKMVGDNAKVWAMPYGNLTLPEVKVSEQPIYPTA
ncbi:MAG: nickel-dependent lactate racemase [Nitrososphaerota archaeon]|nr:nickel-dependent lactate racemase [Candidatus Bathyarchaeota archaeon]MDW8022828.1 nickel-dependent lactate racemase [Nitrososphaerota archaeon]